MRVVCELFALEKTWDVQGVMNQLSACPALGLSKALPLLMPLTYLCLPIQQSPAPRNCWLETTSGVCNRPGGHRASGRGMGRLHHIEAESCPSMDACFLAEWQSPVCQK